VSRGIEALAGFIVGLFAMEYFDITGWLAHKLVRWSVRLRYRQPERLAAREEELAALINDLPRLFRLPTALGFVSAAVGCGLMRHRRARRERYLRPSPGTRARAALYRQGLVLAPVLTLFGIEYAVAASLISRSGVSSLAQAGLAGLVMGLAAGLLAIVEALARPRLAAGLASGLALGLLITLGVHSVVGTASGFGVGAGFGLGIAFAASTVRFRSRISSIVLTGLLSLIFIAAFVVLMNSGPLHTANPPTEFWWAAGRWLTCGSAAGCVAGMASSAAGFGRGHHPRSPQPSLLPSAQDPITSADILRS
jgi:hypothetical protein